VAGTALLVVNTPFGWGCVAGAGWMATRTHEPSWLALGAIGYGLSWAMLGGAVLLLGREGMEALRSRRRPAPAPAVVLEEESLPA